NPAAGSGQADYRGGASYLRGWGAAANDGERGWFSEAGADAVYVSRYDHNSLLYTQFRRGYTLPDLPGGLRLQPLWNANWTVDARRQWWGNFIGTRAPACGMPLPARLLISILLMASWWCCGQGLDKILAPLSIDPSQAVLVVGDSPEARSYGFHPTKQQVKVRSLI